MENKDTSSENIGLDEACILIHNITVKVSNNIHDEWLQWKQQLHIPKMMATGCFEKFQMSRILEIDDTDGPTYTVQYYIKEKEAYNHYLKQFAEKLQRDSINKWGDDVISFSTLMQVVH